MNKDWVIARRVKYIVGCLYRTPGVREEQERWVGHMKNSKWRHVVREDQ